MTWRVNLNGRLEETSLGGKLREDLTQVSEKQFNNQVTGCSQKVISHEGQETDPRG